MERPQNIGIKAIELYFPSQCVAQEELEKFDGVSAGKYTIGLGQTKMAFCDDREDIYSMALTTVSSLIRKYNIDTNQIGRLEVGTETLLDKSKSVKTVLMQLFGENSNIEGVDTINACYGGTNALFNAVNWVESSGWDGRDAIVVAGDIALYKKGNARPTGGAGCVAMLVGPNAPLVMEPGLRGSHMANVYDFYKADLTSEYPLVDGHYSLTCYTRALDSCYKAYNKREATLKARLNGHANGVHPEPETPLDRFDFMSFHVPTCKLVSKCYARLLYNDFLADPENALFKDVPAEVRSLSYEQSLTDKTVEKTFMALAKKRFAARVQPAIQVPTLTGNMYTASVYSSLISLISNVPSADLQGKRITLFSYGSGLASSMFSIKVNGSLDEIITKLDINSRLAARRTLPPQEYESMCTLREKAHLKNNYQPTGVIDTLAPGTYYLTNVDEMFKRTYEIKQ